MQTHRFFVTVASLLTVAAAQADVYMGLGVHKTFDQLTANKLVFQGGELNLLLRDGLVIIDAACVTQPDVVPFPPSDIPPCPLGATGFIAAGDVDRDGIRDDNQYWSVLSVIPALAIEPFRPELCMLYSAPPSKLPRPLQGFREDGVITFYDINDTAMRQYNQSRYELIRRYGSVQQVETVTCQGLMAAPAAGGIILVTISGADIPGSPLEIPVTVAPLDVVEVWAERVRTALAANADLTSVYGVTRAGANVILTENVADGDDPTLNIRIDGLTATTAALPLVSSQNTTVGKVVPGQEALNLMNDELVNGQYTFTFPALDRPELQPVPISINITPNVEAIGSMPRMPRTGFRFTSGLWDDGYYQMDPRLINKISWKGNDRSNIRPNDQFFFSILAGEGNTVAFPPTGNPVILTSPAVTSYTLPPFFFKLGDEGRINLNFSRFLPMTASGVAYDVSDRFFRARIRMVDTYTGFSGINFPQGTTKRETTEKANYDRDAWTNLEEYAFEWPTADYINFLNPDGNEATNDASNLGFGFPAAVDPDPFRSAVVADPPGSFPKIAVPEAELDAENHIVVKASKRPMTGTTLKYDFQILDTSRIRPVYKPIRVGADWTITEVTEVETLIIGGVSMDLSHDYVVLRSTLPVADPSAELPEFKVKVTARKL